MSVAPDECPLVLIEWEDSRQPRPAWVHLRGLEEPDVVQCASVGWLIHDGADVKALAPNMGDIAGDIQASGIIHIPARCIARTIRLREPKRK